MHLLESKGDGRSGARILHFPAQAVVDLPVVGKEGVQMGLRFWVPRRDIVDPHRLCADAEGLWLISGPDVGESDGALPDRRRLRSIASCE